MTKNLEEKVEWLDYYFHLMSPPSKVDYEMWPKSPPSYRYDVTAVETVRFRENVFV
jgi:hypothetical protein